MDGLMHVHVVMRSHRLKVQMLLVGLRLRTSLRSSQVEGWRRARVERLFVVWLKWKVFDSRFNISAKITHINLIQCNMTLVVHRRGDVGIRAGLICGWMTLCLLSGALISSLIVVGSCSVVPWRSVPGVVCRLLGELSGVGVCGHLLWIQKVQLIFARQSSCHMVTYRVNLCRELLETAWHHISSIEVRIRRKIHQLLAWGRLLRLHRARVVVSSCEPSVGSHSWVSNRCQVRGGRSVVSHACSETRGRLVLVVPGHGSHSRLYELHVLEVEIGLLLVECRLNVGAHEWNILNNVVSTIAAGCRSSAHACRVRSRCCTTRSLTRFQRGRSRRLCAGEAQRWRINTTRCGGIRAHRRRHTASGIVGTKTRRKFQSLARVSCQASKLWCNEQIERPTKVRSDSQTQKRLKRWKLTRQTRPALP